MDDTLKEPYLNTKPTVKKFLVLWVKRQCL